MLAERLDVAGLHTRRIPRSSLLEVAIVDGKTGALVWRQARDGAEEPEAAVAALAAMLPAHPASRRASTAVTTTANDT